MVVVMMMRSYWFDVRIAFVIDLWLTKDMFGRVQTDVFHHNYGN